MVLDKLGDAIKKATDKIASAIFVDKKLIDSVVKDLQRALLEADVSVKLVKEISDELRKQGEKKLKGVEKKEQIIKILHDKLIGILGKEEEIEIKNKKKPVKVLLLGLYGAGKTTTIAKLTNYHQKRGHKTSMIGLDVHRPAAPEQLEQLAKQHNLKVYIDKNQKNPGKIYKKHEKELKKQEIIFIDTAGRHTLDKGLIKEIKNLGKLIKPDYTILVMPADIGQAAGDLAKQFQDALNINGVIITRMDSTAKGGGALTACSEVNAPVFYITTGEKINDLEKFNPESFLSRLLGMGDLQALMEKIQSVQSPEKLKERLKQGKFTMDDFLEQLKGMQGLGPLSKVMDLIPGMGKMKDKMPENMLEEQQKNMKKWKAAIQSMTPEEKENPEIIEKQTSRLQRIAKGSGNTTRNVRELLSQYSLIKDFATSGKDFENMDISKLQKGGLGISQKKLRKLAKKFKGMRF